jgi:hypothetical protein
MRRLACTLALIAPLCAATAWADPPRSSGAREADRAAQSAMLASHRLLRLLDEARRAGDRSGSACVDGKLSQVNSFARRILDQRQRLRAAERRGDGSGAAHVRTVLRTLRAQMQRLEREGRACVDALAEERGTTVVTIVDRDVPEEEPSLLTEEDRRRWGRP